MAPAELGPELHTMPDAMMEQMAKGTCGVTPFGHRQYGTSYCTVSCLGFQSQDIVLQRTFLLFLAVLGQLP